MVATVVASLLAIASASAQTVTATDGGTAAYGTCNGVAIDFAAATNALDADWTPSLVSGASYVLNSIAIKNSAGNTGSYYLGVYTNLSGGALSGFLGVSDIANNFSTSANNWMAFTFSNINCSVTVNSVVGS